jgi:hypothetical protein
MKLGMVALALVSALVAASADARAEEKGTDGGDVLLGDKAALSVEADWLAVGPATGASAGVGVPSFRRASRCTASTCTPGSSRPARRPPDPTRTSPESARRSAGNGPCASA